MKRRTSGNLHLRLGPESRRKNSIQYLKKKKKKGQKGLTKELKPAHASANPQILRKNSNPKAAPRPEAVKKEKVSKAIYF